MSCMLRILREDCGVVGDSVRYRYIGGSLFIPKFEFLHSFRFECRCIAQKIAAVTIAAIARATKKTHTES